MMEDKQHDLLTKMVIKIDEAKTYNRIFLQFFIYSKV